MPQKSPDSAEEPVYPMRLQKFLSRAGAASRRGSEDLMTAGRVTVNGEVVKELGSKVDPNVDEVAVDGKVVSLAQGPTYLILNKPSDTVTTMDDPQGRRCVRDLMPSGIPGLFPVGRLDRNTTGILLLTTDGDLAHRLMHPSFHVEKTYQALVEGRVDDSVLEPLREGIELEDGLTKPARVVLEKSGSSRSRVMLRISEGRKRQVRRMFDAIGHPVIELHRSRFGPLSVEGMEPGTTRKLTEVEVRELRRSAGMGGD